MADRKENEVAQGPILNSIFATNGSAISYGKILTDNRGAWQLTGDEGFYRSKVDYLCPSHTASSVTRLGDLLDFGELYKAFGNN